MAQVLEKIPLRELKLEGLACRRILDVLVEEEACRHAHCRLHLLLEEPLKTAELLEMGQQKKITLKQKDGGILFCGIVDRVLQEEREGMVFLRVFALSLSSQLDRKKKSRTFQSTKKTLKDVLGTVAKTSDCKGADLQGGTEAGKAIPQMLYQDAQTDWEFLLRLSKSRGALLFTDGKSDIPRVSIGPIPFKGQTPKPLLWERGKRVRLSTAERIQKNTCDKARPAHFTETELVTGDLRLGVGYSLSYDNIAQIIKKSRIVTEGSVLINILTLVPKEGCRPRAWEELREANRGKYLAGKVLEAKGKDTGNQGFHNRIKVQFDCDEKQDKNDACWIPYMNVINNYMYSMPDEGDRVSVYFEENGTILAIGSLRDQGGESRLQDCKPENKTFLSSGQLLEFQPKELSLTAGKKEKHALLKEDTQGITLQAKKNVLMKSDGDIILQASAGQTLSKQTQLMAAHMTGYTPYLATMGQPSSVQLNPMGGMVGKSASSLKSAGAQEEKAELSELAKALDKKTGSSEKKAQKESSSSSGGGTLKIKSGGTLLLKVGDSSIEVSKGNIKTRALFTGAYIPGPGAGTGSPAAIGPGKPSNRSSGINAEHGEKDRSRLKEGGRISNDNKRISKGG